VPDLNLLAVLVAALVCFIIGATYYAVMSTRLDQARANASSDPTASTHTDGAGPPKPSTLLIWQ
jgi:hypothetical protein